MITLSVPVVTQDPTPRTEVHTNKNMHMHSEIHGPSIYPLYIIGLGNSDLIMIVKSITIVQTKGTYE